jgi:hypothetical protein
VSGTGRVRVVAPFAAALVTVVAMALVAGAHHTDLVDRNDARGKLDVREVRLRHEGTPPFWSVVTFAEWGVREMWDRGYVMVLLDTAKGEAAEYYLLVRSNGRAMEGSLWRVRAVGPDSRLGTVEVRRLSRRSVSVQVGLFRLTFGEKRDFYRWWVHTTYTSDVCRRTCHDRAPNRGGVVQWRPGRSPSPSEAAVP